MKPGVKAFVVYNKKILFVKRDNNPSIPYPNMWNLPGGGVEEGESNEEALIRELKEEINLSPKEIVYLGKQIFPVDKLVARYLVPINEADSKSLVLLEEGQEMNFFSIDEMVNLDTPPNLKDYLLRIKEPLRNIVEKGKKIDMKLLELS